MGKTNAIQNKISGF
jgi:hypothetical protein